MSRDGISEGVSSSRLVDPAPRAVLNHSTFTPSNVHFDCSKSCDFVTRFSISTSTFETFRGELCESPNGPFCFYVCRSRRVISLIFILCGGVVFFVVPEILHPPLAFN